MNTAQKIVLWISFCLILASALYAPWFIGYYKSNASKYPNDSFLPKEEYHFILNDIVITQFVSEPSYHQGGYYTPNFERRPVGTWHLDSTRILLEELCIVLLTISALAAHRKPKPNP